MVLPTSGPALAIALGMWVAATEPVAVAMPEGSTGWVPGKSGWVLACAPEVEVVGNELPEATCVTHPKDC